MANEAEVKAALLSIYAGLGRADPDKAVANLVKTWASHCVRFSPMELNAAAQTWITTSETPPTLSGFLSLLQNERDRSPMGRRDPQGCSQCRGSGRRNVYAWQRSTPTSDVIRGQVYVSACDCQAGQAIRNYGTHEEVAKRLEQSPITVKNESGWPCVWVDGAGASILQVQDAHRPPGALPRPKVSTAGARTWVAMAERGAREQSQRRDEYEPEEGEWR